MIKVPTSSHTASNDDYSMQCKKRKIVSDAKKVFARLKQYDNLSFLERYAIFMMRIQQIELLLKHLLADERGYDFEKIEKYTSLSDRFFKKLKKEGMHNSLISFLDDLKEYRDHFAHEFLANQIVMRAILKDTLQEYSKPERLLFRALFSAEQFLLICEEIPKGGFWKKK